MNRTTIFLPMLVSVLTVAVFLGATPAALAKFRKPVKITQVTAVVDEGANTTTLTMIFPHDIGHKVKLSSQIPSVFGVQSQSLFSADYNTFPCIQRYWFLPGAESRTVPGEPVRLSGYERSSP